MSPATRVSMMAYVALAVMSFSTVAALEPNFAFNYTVPDTARFIRYISGNGTSEVNDSDSSWRTRFDVENRPSEDSLFGGGNSLHAGDAIVNNILTFAFVGTRAVINGVAKGFVRGPDSKTSSGAPRYSMQLNYTNENNIKNLSQPIPNGEVLADTGDQPFGFHTVRLTLPPGTQGGLWSITGVTIATRIQAEAKEFRDIPIQKEYAVLDEQLNPRWKFSQRGWMVEQPFDAAGSMRTTEPWASYVHATASGDETTGASVAIDIPANTSYIVINGTSGPSAGRYSVTFDPPSLLRPAFPNQPTGLASADWVTPVVMALTPLDPSVKYTVTISGNKAATGGGLSIYSVTYYRGVNEEYPALVASSPSGSGGEANPSQTGGSSPIGNTTAAKKNGTNVGAIVGGVIGGIIGIGIIIGLLFWLFRRRGRRVHREDPSEFIIDETLNTPNPYPVKQMTKRQEAGESHYSSPPSTDGYGSEQLGILAPPPAVPADSRGFNTLLSPLSPVSPMNWGAVGQSPASPAGLSSYAASPTSPIAMTTTPFAAMGTPDGANLARAGRTRRNARGRRVHQEADGGSLHQDESDLDECSDQDDVLIVPPSYDPAWSRERLTGRGERSRRPGQRTQEAERNRTSWTNELAMRLKR